MAHQIAENPLVAREREREREYAVKKIDGPFAGARFEALMT